jgi:hypothetical protein
MNELGEGFFVKYHQDLSVKFCHKHKTPLMTCNKNLKYGVLHDINCMDIKNDFISYNDLYFYDQYMNLVYDYKDLIECKQKKLEEFVAIYPENINRVKLSKLQSGYYEHVKAWDKDWITKLIGKKNKSF